MKRVLLIEDDPHLRETMGETLTFEGFDPIPAHSVFQVFELVANHEPDLILCDWSLPDGSALDVLQAFPNHPVIVITADSSPDKIDMALSHGARGYLMKPFTRQELVGAACRALLMV